MIWERPGFMFDLLLTGAVLVFLPGYGFWRTWREGGGHQVARMRRYVRSLAMAGVLSTAVVGEWFVLGRDWRSLGLGLPPTGLVGLAAAAVILLGAGLAMRAASRRSAPRRDEATLEMLPVTAAETRMFVLFSVGIGFGWELLYRGYLLWALSPRVGLAGAVLLSAGAYGVAHGYRGAKPFVGSLISAFVFTVAYALTHSIWWLAAIHVGLPLLALNATRRASLRVVRGEAATAQ
jgi:membrane protease YdiL (CAAX protease family)